MRHCHVRVPSSAADGGRLGPFASTPVAASRVLGRSSRRTGRKERAGLRLASQYRHDEHSGFLVVHGPIPLRLGVPSRAGHGGHQCQPAGGDGTVRPGANPCALLTIDELSHLRTRRRRRCLELVQELAPPADTWCRPRPLQNSMSSSTKRPGCLPA